MIPKKIMEFVDARLSRHGRLGTMLVKGVVGTAGIKLASAGIGFLTAILLAKTLGPSGYGTYSFVMALVAFLTIPSELGIPGLAIREIAVANAKEDWSHMRGFIVRAHQAIGLFSLILMSLGAILLLVWGDRVDPIKRHCMWLGLLLVPLVSLGALRGGMLRGLRNVLLGQLPEQVIRPLALLSLLLLLPLIVNGPATAVNVMVLQVLSVTTAFLFGLYFFVRTKPHALANAAPVFRTATWLKSSIPFGMTAALQLVNGRTDIIVLGLFREDAEVGVYRIATQMAALVVFALQAVNAIQGPHIAHLYAQGDMQKLQTMVTRSSQAIMMYALPVVLIVVIFGEFIIRTVFGPRFEGAYIPMVILCVGQLVNSAIGSVASLLNMTGHERDTTRSILIGALINVALNFTLTPAWGITGAAVATAATLTTWNLIMWRKVHQRLGIETSPLYRRRK